MLRGPWDACWYLGLVYCGYSRVCHKHTVHQGWIVFTVYLLPDNLSGHACALVNGHAKLLKSGCLTNTYNHREESHSFYCFKRATWRYAKNIICDRRIAQLCYHCIVSECCWENKWQINPGCNYWELLIYQHHWTPPKGHLDQLSNGDWEDEMVAALRETEEEAGIGKHHLKV